MSGANVFKRLKVSTHTDTGRRRQKNEDSLLCLPDQGVFIVADGMGGAGGGDVASKSVIDHLRSAFAEKSELGMTDKISLFREACDESSRWIKARADRDNMRGMGSTVVGIVFDHLDEFYPKDVVLFKKMVKEHQIDIPQGLCKNLTETQMDTMIDIALSLVPLWENALGDKWEDIMTREKLRNLYLKM